MKIKVGRRLYDISQKDYDQFENDITKTGNGFLRVTDKVAQRVNPEGVIIKMTKEEKQTITPAERFGGLDEQ